MNAIQRSADPGRFLTLGILIALTAALAACNRPSGDEPGSCAPEDLVAPDPTYPEHHSVIDDLSPTFRWTYPDYSCLPSEYKVELLTSNSWFDTGPILAQAILPGTTMEWDPGVTLVPGDIYSFFIRARVDGEPGPGIGIFFHTGPLCSVSGDAVQAPVLVAPADGERLTSMRAHLRWDDPTPCVNYHHYWIEVARSPRFTGAYLGWNSIFEDEALPNDEFSLEPCTTYYWRVRSGSSGVAPDGPTSETWSFTTPAEPGRVCLIAPVITPLVPWFEFRPPEGLNGAIAGHVWHDECAVPYATTDTVPPGCVLLPDGRLEANGALDPDEVGIEGVTVLLDDGPCPGTDGWSTVTDVNGQYTFHGLAAGTYCVEIDDAADGNDRILIPGNWTVPYRWYGPGPISAEVTLGSDDDISRLNDFGWDYQFLPSPSGSGASGTPFARILTDTRCRLGPGVNYPILTYLSPGQLLPIIGRDANRTWWQVTLPDPSAGCWLADDVIDTQGDTGQVPQQQAPPPPSPTPVMGCWQRPNPQLPARCVVPCPAGVQDPSYCTP